MSGVAERSQSQLCGILNINKPEGWTSFDVIAKLRGITHIKRLGHAGTLDPMATGVLPVFVGKATKACDIIPDRKKIYRAGFKLGISTDTEDVTGEIIRTYDMSRLEIDKAVLESAVKNFLGDIMQIPPMYSAVKVNGKKLYEYAREGKTVERPARKIHIDSIFIHDYDKVSHCGSMTVECEKGTYIRTLIADIGNSLNAGGAMSSLERLYSGGCDISDSLTLEQVSKICNEGELSQVLTPLDRAFSEYEEIKLGSRESSLYKNGVKLCAKQVGQNSAENVLYRVYDAEGEFLGVGHFQGELFRSVKNFY